MYSFKRLCLALFFTYCVLFTVYLHHQLPEWVSDQSTSSNNVGSDIYENDFEVKQDLALSLSDIEEPSEYRKAFISTFRSYYDNKVKPLPLMEKGVIIFSYQRSGTSFLGQLFNQHEDAFYTFEPLMPFYDICETQVGDKLRVIKATLQCDFPDVELSYTNHNRAERIKYRVHSLCLKENFCFRENTRELCGKELCPFGDRVKCKHCGPIHMQQANNMCRSKQVSVVKAIRLCNVRHLKLLAEDPSMDVRILHLVRDPRGIQSSRKKINAESTWKLNSSKELCNRMLQNGKVGLSVTGDTEWLTGRYMLVRYEDVAHNPMQKAEEIYRFSGLDFNPSVRTWIKQNTQASAKDTPINPYATRRNSSSTAESWKSYLSFEEILRIQEDCAEVMEMFGYKPVKDKSELPIPKNQRLTP